MEEDENIHQTHKTHEIKIRGKKVLFCASAASHIINFHNIYFEYLNGMGFDVHTASGINPNDNSNIDLIKSQKNYVLTFEKGKKLYKNINTVFKLAKLIRREKYDIVSTHSMLAGLVGRLAVMLVCNRKIRVIHTCHGYLFNDDKSFKSRLIILIEKFLSMRTDVLFVMNSDDYKIAVKYKLCKKIEYTNGMGIDAEKLNKKSDKINHADFQKYNIPQDKKCFLCIGEFSRRKNQKNIINAFSRFIRDLPDNLYNAYHLIFLGDGVLMRECEELCGTLGITDHVTFCGYAGDTAVFYKFSYCCVSASRFEGMPFNVIEALYYGKPVIASNVKGHKDLISDGFNGYLYDYNDHGQLAKFFERIINAEIYTELISNVYLDEKYYFGNVKENVLKWYGSMQS